MNIYDIKQPKDIKECSIAQLQDLAQQIRVFLIQSIAKTGGHLSSNLGVVELTLAMHYVFDSPTDKFIFDVGHQSYVHKILTGRGNQFASLRQYKGIAGFQKRKESEHDVWEAGHSSTSLSAALGMAVGRDLHKDTYQIVPVIGDGALSGGMAMEALNQIGSEQRNMVIIFNDNNMSISQNVGAMDEAFTKLRTSKPYTTLKEDLKGALSTSRMGSSLLHTMKSMKNAVKENVVDTSIFGDFNLDYIGPVDGHDLKMLIKVLKIARQHEGPIVVHVITKKGKGYRYAEEDREGKWHGVSQFDPETGESLAKLPAGHKSWSEVISATLMELAEHDERIVAITPAMKSGSKLSAFFDRYPMRSFDCGIAEEHAMTFAAGLCTQDIRPFISVYSSFLQRAYDQIVHDVCMQKLHVVFAIDRAGIVGADGETHQGVFDISFLSHIPNMTVLSPKNAWELEEMLDFAVNEWNGPIAVRYPRGTAETAFAEQKEPITYGKAEVIQKGRDIAVLAEGHMLKPAAEAAERLEAEGYHPVLVNMRFLNPLDTELLKEIAETCAHIVTVEDNLRKGGFGSKVLEYYGDAGIQTDVLNLAFPDKYIEQGTQAQLFERYGLDAAGIYNSIKERLGE